MKNLISLFLLLSSLNAFAICMYPEDAELYECLPMNKPATTKWCQEKYGVEFDAFLTNNTCSKELAYSLRGEEYKASKVDVSGQVKAACISFEQGQKLGCEYYDYQLAQNFCNEKFGMKYIAFVPSNKCSLETASKLRGEVASHHLLDNLNSSVDELETLITMIDQEGSMQSLENIGSKEINIGNEFYTKTMTNILSYMKQTKDTLYKNSQKNIELKADKYVISFLRQALKYTGLLSRVYKIYAHVAHKNSYVLKSYDFENLDKLNLILKKEYALELLAKINYKVKNVNNDKDIEFIVSSEERQTFEYMAVSKPESKMEYAKLLTFMGSREVVTNHWAVQRLTTKAITVDNTRSCGQGFLSLRPKQNTMTQSDAYQSLWEYDVFFNDYATRWESIVKASWDAAILDEAKAQSMLSSIFRSNSAVVAQIENNLESSDIKSELRSRVNSDSSIFKDSEDQAWMNFSNYHFSTIVFPGDDILSKSNVINKIVQASYDKRKEAIVDTFVAMYPYMSDANVSSLKKSVESYIDNNLKSSFITRASNAIYPSFEGYNSLSKRNSNRDHKVKETLKVLKEVATAIAVEAELGSDKPDLSKMKKVRPHNMKEFMTVFEAGMSIKLSSTLTYDQGKAKIAEGFFKEINSQFVKEFTKRDSTGNTVLANTREAREEGLKRIVHSVSSKYFKLYPYHAINSSLLDERYTLRTTAIDNTYVRKPVFKNGTVLPMKTSDLKNEFKKLESYGLSKDVYTIKRDNTAVALPTIMTGNYIQNTYLPRYTTAKAGYNKDKISTGEVVINDSISSSDLRSLRSISKDPKLAQSLKGTTAFGSKKDYAKLTKQLNQKLDQYKKDQVLSTTEEMFHEIFTSLGIVSKFTKKININHGLAEDNYAQLNLASHYLTGAYQAAPILRSDVYWTETRQVRRGSRSHTVTDKKSGPLTKKIIASAYNKTSGYFNETEALKYINQAFDNTIENASKKISDFCSANYTNYKNDEGFKKIFKASTFLRSHLKSPVGISAENYSNIQSFDEQMTKELRSKMEALNEDYLEPILLWSGIVAMVALAIVFCVGTGGTGIPAVIVGYASLIGTADMIISAPIIAASLIARTNTHFIEMPAQMKFNTSLAHSQLGQSSIIDWDMHRNAKKEMKSQQMWQIGFMALDVFFVGSLGQHVKRATGIVARNSYKKATGIALRAWSAPTPSMYKNISFKQFRANNNFFKAVKGKIGNAIDKVRLYQPKFQAIPVSQIKTNALRQGLVKEAKKLGIDNKPWSLLNDLSDYSKKLADRTEAFKAYSKAEGKIIEGVYGNNITAGELMKYGREYSKTRFVFKSFIKAVQENRLMSYFTKFGDELNELRALRGKMIDGRVKDIQVAIDKLVDLKKAKAGISSTGDEFADFLSKLSDDEILALQQVSNDGGWIKRVSSSSANKTFMQKLRPAFKGYENVASGFRNPIYMDGIKGASTKAAKIIYPRSYLLADNDLLVEDAIKTYKFNTDAEDITNVYESLVKQTNLEGQELSELAHSIETRLSTHFKYDTNGNRIFID